MTASANVLDLHQSQEDKLMTELPLFPTASAKEASYAFIKHSRNFHNKSEYKILDEAVYHHASTVKKLPKVGRPNLLRESKLWFEIENELVADKEIHRQNALIVLLGEIYRFEIGSTQPKYRIYQLSSEQAYPISEGVPGYVEFFTYFSEHMCLANGDIKQEYTDKDLFEGMGRVIFNKFLYYENDFHFGNMCLNKDNYFVGIDHDNSLAPLLLKLKNKYKEHPLAMKIVQRGFEKSLIHYPRKECIDHKDYLWRIKDRYVTAMGTPHVFDYDHLPTVLYYLPAKWQFEVTHEFSEYLAKDERFLNEKHFSMLKALITSYFKHALIEIHVGDDSDRITTHLLITQRLIEMKKLAKQSNAFLAYVKMHRVEAIKNILYELADFLKNNKHYQYASDKAADIQWQIMCTKTLDEFSELLMHLNFEALSSTEKSRLEKFAREIHQQNGFALEEIRLFYINQKMNYHANQIQQKTDAMRFKNALAMDPGDNSKPKLSRLATLGTFAATEAKPVNEGVIERCHSREGGNPSMSGLRAE